MNIATYYCDGSIYLRDDFEIIKAGEKITPGKAALLDLLGIRSTDFKIPVKKVMMDGNLFEPHCLNFTTKDILSAFSRGAGDLTAHSLGSGIITSATAPHLITHSFKNLAAVAIATNYSFPEADRLKAASEEKSEEEMGTCSEMMMTIETAALSSPKSELGNC